MVSTARRQRIELYNDVISEARQQGTQCFYAAMATLGRNDLFFLLTTLLKRRDMECDWLFDRCEEVQQSPDGHLDLWAREHYKSTIITFGQTIRDILCDPEITIGIFSHCRPMAKDFLNQIKYEFEQNTLLKRCYADVLWQQPRTQAPILDVIPFQEASHGLWNMYEDVMDVQGAGWVAMNAPLPGVDVTSQLRKVDLSILGGEVEVPEDTANMFGGREKYFARKLPKVLRRSGMDAEQRILYDNFRAWALDKGRATSAGATSGGTYSILAVRFYEGETCGLYSPECFKQGALLDTQPINGGDLYKAASGAYQGVLVYGLRIKAYLGMQIGNPNSVAAVVNINSSNIPTEAMIDDMLASVRASAGSTYLFMHERARNLLMQYKSNALQISPGGRDFDRQITHWNGIEIVTSYNFMDGSEPIVTL